MAGERFNRELGKPRLTEAPLTGIDDAELDSSALLTRLELQAAESGRLDGRVQTLERALKTEREARRRLGETLQRERKAAKALHDRAERDRTARAQAEAELERAREGLTLAEQQMQMAWARLTQVEHELALKHRSTWRKLLRRPPRD